MILAPGKRVYIQSYKHDGSLHRTWAMGYVLDADDEKVVLVTDKTWVTESDGRRWLTREPAICYFYYHYWMNVICMMRKNGLYYYCNLASPVLWDSEALKYIDYDLDIKVFPDGKRALLDEDEYAEHSEEMHYSSEIKEIVEDEVNTLNQWIDEHKGPFDPEEIDEWFEKYLAMVQ